MLIQHARVVTPDGVQEADIRAEGETIVEIGAGLSPQEGEECIDAAGLLAVPGGIDAHTHFDMPCGDIKTSDDFFEGTRAAILGGTTSILDFAEPESGTDLYNGLSRWHEKADGKSFCDYGFHMTLSRYDAQIEAEIRDMISAGITSFKAYTAYRGDIGVDDRDLYRLMELMAKYKTLLMIHCENGDILDQRREELGARAPRDIYSHPLSRPNAVEHDAVSRVIDMGALTGAAVYVVHTSTAEGLAELKAAKARGQEVYCESCTQYLELTEEMYRLPGFEGAKYVCSPPLRKKEDQDALWQGLRDRVIDTISTDHCSFNFADQKSLGLEDFRRIPNGLPGVEQRLELLYSDAAKHGLSYADIARVTAENPARTMGLWPKKGALRCGSDADIVLIDPVCPHVISHETQHQHVDYTPYEGMCLSHRVRDVFLRGRCVVRGGVLLEEAPAGAYLRQNFQASGSSVCK